MAVDYKKEQRFWEAKSRSNARLAYLTPLLFALWIWIGAAVPHLWFVYEGEARETLDLFTLVSNTWGQCNAVIETSASTGYEQNFAHLMRAAVIVFWVTLILFTFFAVMVSTLSLIAFAMSPTDKYTNRVKRILHLLCPNRITYLILCALPILPTLFAHLLEWSYNTLLGMKVQLYFEGHHDLLIAVIGAALSIALFLLSLPDQKSERMDMFRIYKSGRDVPRKGEETL